jgi:cyclophilin family peptidyl-prolyl cis-trans isomerase/HEAT repeat protein
LLTFLFSPFLPLGLWAQVPIATQIQILKAEDARRYDKTLEDMLKHPHYDVRTRAALAIGRIGDARAIPVLVPLLEKGTAKEREMAAFALGEIESIEAADAILSALGVVAGPGASGPPKLTESARVFTRVAGNGNGVAAVTQANASSVTARLVEAAGKIAAANPNDPKSKELGAAIVNVLNEEEKKRSTPSTEVIRLGLTAALRARPAGSEETIRKFLAFTDPNIVADALNTLARLRAKNANRDARDLLATHVQAIVRANAARVLGAAEDKDAVEILTNAALKDPDSRVRVSAIRSLIPLRDAKVAEHLIGRGHELMKVYERLRKKVDGPEQVLPPEKNELLEIATALGRLLANTKHAEGWNFLESFRYVDKHYSSEVEVAMARVDPEKYLTVSNIGGVYMSRKTRKETYDWRVANSLFAALSEYAAIAQDSPLKAARAEAQKKVAEFIEAPSTEFPKADPVSFYPAIANALGTLARFKPADMNSIALRHLAHPNVDVRAAAANAIGDLPPSKENVDTLTSAFTKALLTDKDSNDAQLAIIDALYKLDKNAAAQIVVPALGAADHLVRTRVIRFAEDKQFQDSFPALTAVLGMAKTDGKKHVHPYSPKSGTKLGQVLNTDADYRRAALRKNGSVKAVVTTSKGSFTIDFLPEDAPLTVDNFVKLARSGYFNGVEVHRVVPNFVMQDGDPRGDGNGGPGWSIRCEVNMVPYERGAVGMALSGKDTGGSQWFVTHSPQPHLDGGYTVFGKVNETGMKVVDIIVRGDKITSIRIVGN